MIISNSGVVRLGAQAVGVESVTSDRLMDGAPEVYEESPCYTSDVWSLGMSAIEMAEGKHPFADNRDEVMKNTMSSSTPSLTSNWSSDLRGFVSMCLMKDAKKRASVKELLKVSDMLGF